MTTATAREARQPRAAPAQRPPLSVVARRRRSLRILSAVAIVLVLVVIFGSVAFQAMIVQNQSAIDEVDARIALLEEQRQDLLVRQAELMDPERLSAYATDRLGMVEPEQSAVIVLEPVSPVELGLPRTGQAP